MIIPKGKTVYVGARKFVEGDILPPFVHGIQFKENIIPKAKIIETIEEKPKKRGRPRKTKE